MWPCRLAALLGLALTAVAPLARAEEPRAAVATAPEPQAQTNWYGWQILLADALSVGLVYAGGTHDQGAVVVAGLGAYGLGGPVVHLGHGRDGLAVASIGLRGGLPILGGVIGFFADTSSLTRAAGIAIGVIAGAATASALDISLLAREAVPVAKQPAVSAFSVTPALAVGKQQTVVGAAGTF